MRLLAYRRVKEDEAEDAARKERRRRDPRHDRLLADAMGQQPRDASEFLRMRAERLAQAGR